MQISAGKKDISRPKKNVRLQVNFTLEQAVGNQRYISTLSLTSALDGGSGVNATSQPLYPRERDFFYPLYRRVGGPQGRSGQVRKIADPTAIRPPDRPARSESLQVLGCKQAQQKDMSTVNIYCKKCRYNSQ